MGSLIASASMDAVHGARDELAGPPQQGRLRVPKNFVPLRPSPTEGDEQDQLRVNMVHQLWTSQDDLLRHRNRQIEENIRMLAGQQWAMYHPVTGRWMDITEWMDAGELRWRQRPVFNRLLAWFVLTHARATESQPIVTFEPGPDRSDSDLAETLDIASKALWNEMGMLDVNDRLWGWVIAAGRAHIQPRVDLAGGAIEEWIGEDFIPVVDEAGQPIIGPDGQPLSQLAQGVPFGPDGKPLAVWRAAGGDPSRGEMVPTGKAHTTRKGRIVTDVFSPLQVRGQWGPQPWHQKRWHGTKLYLTPEEVFDLTGEDCEPDIRGSLGDVGELERVLFGTGFFGASDSRVDSQFSTVNTDGYCEITTLWKAPCGYGGMEETKESPGGRYTMVSRTKCLYDGVRPGKFRYTSPIRCFDFVRMPGRPSGTSPLEVMNPIQRSINRGYGQIQEHVNLCTNPKGIIDSQSGIKDGQFDNEPGANYIVNRRSGVPAVEYIAPPQLGQDTYKFMQMLSKELEDMGNLAGTQGEPLSPDQSGEAIKELRFNSDRFLGPTMRRAVPEYGRFNEDLMVLMPIVWDAETVISYAGEDNVARTITILPHLFEEGNVNVRADVESMLPEGRGERQARIYKMWLDGAWGDPRSPEALKQFHELARFPHLSRAAKPGGIHRTTAEQFLGRLVQGEDPRTIPLYEWYDENVHLAVLTEFMAGPEYERQSEQVQEALAYRREALMFQAQNKMMQAAMQQAQMSAMLAPPDPDGDNDAGGPKGKGGKGGGGGSGDGAPPSRSVLPAGPSEPSGGAPGGNMPTLPLRR